MNKKLMVFKSFKWAAAMLVVALVEVKLFIVLLIYIFILNVDIL